MSRQRGTLLLDFLQAAVIFGVVTTIFFTAFRIKWTILTDTTFRTQATSAATSELERLRAFGIDPAALGGKPDLDGWYEVRRFAVPGVDAPPALTSAEMLPGVVRVRPQDEFPGLHEVEVGVLWLSNDGHINDYRIATLIRGPQ